MEQRFQHRIQNVPPRYLSNHTVLKVCVCVDKDIVTFGLIFSHPKKTMLMKTTIIFFYQKINIFLIKKI